MGRETDPAYRSSSRRVDPLVGPIARSANEIPSPPFPARPLTLTRSDTAVVPPFLACDLGALSPDERVRHAALSRQLAYATASITDLPDGFAFHYRPDDATWAAAAEYVDLERRCCPFFAFALFREPAGGAVRLHLTGGPGVKAFLASQIGRPLTKRPSEP